MGKLVYAINTSLDGYVEDADGSFDFSVPDEDVHRYYNDLVRDVGTHLLGRRMYETMAVWETDPSLGESSPILSDFATSWRAADKVVYSTTLRAPVTSRTRIEAAFRPDDVEALVAGSTGDVLVGGPTLAAQMLRAGIVDEVRLVLSPVALGGGKPALAPDARLDLELVDERRFGNGAVLLAYRVQR